MTITNRSDFWWLILFVAVVSVAIAKVAWWLLTSGVL